VLTSPHAASGLRGALAEADRDARALAGVRIAVVGRATAQALARELAVRPDLRPDAQTGAALGAALTERGAVAGRRVLMLRSDIAGERLPQTLADAGAAVIDLPAYRTRSPQSLPDEMLKAMRAGDVDWVTFTSSSTARHFVSLMQDERARVDDVKIASIGPATSATCCELGLNVTVEATRHDLDGLIEAICREEAG
jgi:uroporphyrinogen III methyltransferase/synthase